MAFKIANNNMSNNQEIELRFLRHLVYRVATEHGKYMTTRDKLALQRLLQAHAQDTASTSVEDFALEEYLDLNMPRYPSN